MHLTFSWNHPTKGQIYVEMAATRYDSTTEDFLITGYAADVTEQTLAKKKWEQELLDAKEAAESANSGMNGHLAKPVEIPKLMDALAAVLK